MFAVLLLCWSTNVNRQFGTAPWLGAPMHVFFTLRVKIFKQQSSNWFCWRPFCYAEAYTFIELFAGFGNASRCAIWSGYKVASVDILYWNRYRTGRKRTCRKNRELYKNNRNPLDLNTTSGLALPVFAFALASPN